MPTVGDFHQQRARLQFCFDAVAVFHGRCGNWILALLPRGVCDVTTGGQAIFLALFGGFDSYRLGQSLHDPPLSPRRRLL